MKTFFIITAVFCYIAILNLPYGYYTFLRILVSISCGIYIYENRSLGANFWNIVLGIILVLFNPIIPIYLTKSIWMSIDALVGVVFLIVSFSKKRNDEK